MYSFTFGFGFEDWNGDRSVGTERSLRDSGSVWYIVTPSRCLSASLWKGGWVTRSLWPPGCSGPSSTPCGQRAGAGRVGGLWTLCSLNKHLLGSNCFRAPVLGSSDWAADTLRNGPDLSICFLAGRHLNQWSIQTMWVPLETRQGRPGWGVRVRVRVTAQPCDGATGHAWASDSLELPDLTFDLYGMSLFVLHNDS